MPKLKTNRSVAKRLSKTATGNFKRNKSNKSHILTKKSTKRKRGLRQTTLLNKSSLKNVKKLLPYA